MACFSGAAHWAVYTEASSSQVRQSLGKLRQVFDIDSHRDEIAPWL